jgi:glutaredoxin 3
MEAEVYSSPACSQCMQAKSILKSKNIPYTEYTIGKDVDKTILEERIGATVRSVPQIFVNDEYIGSLVDLKKMLG